MPLEESSSKEALGHNIAKEIAAGKPAKQAEAIAFSVKRKNDTAEPTSELGQASTFHSDDTGEPKTTSAAGILFVTPEKRALFLKRGPGGDHPGEWCFPGGRQEGDETLLECAVREANEECGEIPNGDRVVWTRATGMSVGSQSVDPEVGALRPEGATPPLVDFTTFRQLVKKEFPPQVVGEHVGWAWAPLDQPPQPLHPGCQIALDRFTMNELGIAEAIRDGRLSSPQKYENVWLFAIRITGTGASYRHKLKEHVWRDPSIYMNEGFLKRCNGLQVIFEHPKKKGMLDSKEFADRTIGSVFLPYLKMDANEVWAIAKVYDDAAAEMMENEQLSTSPAVVFRDPAVNEKVTLEDGSTLLIEGDPSLLDHVAICQSGVWDKGGDPKGVEASSVEERKDDCDPRLDAAFARLDEACATLDERRIDAAYARLDSVLRTDAENNQKNRDEVERLWNRMNKTEQRALLQLAYVDEKFIFNYVGSSWINLPKNLRDRLVATA